MPGNYHDQMCVLTKHAMVDDSSTVVDAGSLELTAIVRPVQEVAQRKMHDIFVR